MLGIRKLSESALSHLPRIAIEIVANNPVRSAWCLFADVFATILQTVAMFSLLYLLTDYQIVVDRARLLTDFEGISNVVLLSVAWTMIFMILVVSGLSSYSGRRTAVKIARAYEQHSIHEVILDLDSGINDGKELNVEALKKFLARGPHYLGRLALEIHLKFVPILTCGVAILAMLYLSWRVTMLVVLMLIIAMPVFVLLNRRATESSKGIAKHAKSHAQRKAHAVTALMEAKGINGYEDALGVDSNYLNSYELRLTVSFASLLYSRMVGAIVIFTALLPWLYLVRVQEATITELGVYFLFLIYFFNGLQGAYGLITKFYIFFPFLEMVTQKNVFFK